VRVCVCGNVRCSQLEIIKLSIIDNNHHHIKKD